MIFVILAVAILGIIVAMYFEERCCSVFPLALIVIFTAILIITICVGVVLILFNAKLSVIDDKIEMYSQENAKIEEQISEVVKQYQEYEKEVFTEVSPENSIALVSLYPELKSDTLVQQQIEVYVANNQKIKELNEEKIDAKVIKWWLYFGG